MVKIVACLVEKKREQKTQIAEDAREEEAEQKWVSVREVAGVQLPLRFQETCLTWTHFIVFVLMNSNLEFIFIFFKETVKMRERTYFTEPDKIRLLREVTYVSVRRVKMGSRRHFLSQTEQRRVHFSSSLLGCMLWKNILSTELHTPSECLGEKIPSRMQWSLVQQG